MVLACKFKHHSEQSFFWELECGAEARCDLRGMKVSLVGTDVLGVSTHTPQNTHTQYIKHTTYALTTHTKGLGVQRISRRQSRTWPQDRGHSP